jgi:hypothetical protein
MPETQYDRPLEAYNGMGYGKTLPMVEPDMDDEKDFGRDKRGEEVHVESIGQGNDAPRLIQITSLTRPDVDNDNLMRRTWLTDLRPFQRKPKPMLGLTTFKHALQLVSDRLVDTSPRKLTRIASIVVFPQCLVVMRPQLLVLDNDDCTLCNSKCCASRPLAGQEYY